VPVFLANGRQLQQQRHLQGCSEPTATETITEKEERSREDATEIDIELNISSQRRYMYKMAHPRNRGRLIRAKNRREREKVLGLVGTLTRPPRFKSTCTKSYRQLRCLVLTRVDPTNQAPSHAFLPERVRFSYIYKLLTRGWRRS